MDSEEKRPEGGEFLEEWETPADDIANEEEETGWSAGTQGPEAAGYTAEATLPSRVSATELVELNRRFKSGANWFFWIAALSALNTILILTETGWSFVVGLGVTQVIDSIARAAMNEGDVPQAVVIGVALFFDFIAAGFCVLFGVLCRYRQVWAFWVGMGLYLLDGLILFSFKMWLSFGFHIFVLLGIYSGLRAVKQLRDLGVEDEAVSAA